MSQKNKIDFTTEPEFSFLQNDFSGSDLMGEHFAKFEIIFDIAKEFNYSFKGFVVALVTFAYLRINGTNAVNKLMIPAEASLENLTYTEGNSFFFDIFNRYKIICEANPLLTDTVTILEHFFTSGAAKLSEESQRKFAKYISELDWSEKAELDQYIYSMGVQPSDTIPEEYGHKIRFTNDVCSLFVERELIRELLVERTTDSAYSDLYRQVHHLAPLLNIKPDEKQLCSPILYNNYLLNTFEISGWPDNGCEKLVKKHLGNVMAVQADPVLWAIHTLETVLFGCNKQLILKADNLSTITKKADGGFDVIFLPEVNYDTIPDVGPIIIGNIVFEKNTNSHNLYNVAFLYNLLNENGRLLVRFDEKAETALRRDEKTCDYHTFYEEVDNLLLELFVDNNLIEAMIQTKNCTYMLINKNRPETKHGKILFYYGQHFGNFIYGNYLADHGNLTLCIKENSCDNIKLLHDEGAVIVSNKEIQLNNYCLLPKKYIYDFDRVKQQVESDMIQHIRHESNQLIPRIGRSLKTLGLFLNKHGLDNEPSQEKRDEDDIVPSVKELIDGSRTNLLQLQSVFTAAREVVLESFDKSNFNPCDLNKLFAEISNYQGHKKYSIQVKGSVKSSPLIYENAFRDMIENIIRNAEVHGFTDARTDYRFVFDISQKGRRVVIKCLNNGEPLPPNFTKDKLFAKGDKGPNSTGMGLGGERIGKILAAHDAGFDVLPIGRLPQGFTVGFQITLSVEREANEQG